MKDIGKKGKLKMKEVKEQIGDDIYRYEVKVHEKVERWWLRERRRKA